MTPTTCHMTISVDGFVAGPDQSRDNPLGVGGLELHHWHLDEPIHEADARARDEYPRRPRASDPLGAERAYADVAGAPNGLPATARTPFPRRPPHNAITPKFGCDQVTNGLGRRAIAP